MFKTAPLPFVGQKRQFLTLFSEILNDNIDGTGAGWTIVDVFGGSGLLSNQAKSLKPDANVIYNDFDDYSNRLKHIGDTNRLRQKLEILLKDCKKLQKIDNDLKENIKTIINNFDGFIDIHTLSTWFLFSGDEANNLESLFKKGFYNRLTKNNYPLSEGYLKDVDVTQLDFKELIKKYAGLNKILLILDPPYLMTDQTSYKNDKNFGLIEFLELMNLIRPPFMIFSSTKSEIVKYLNFIAKTEGQNWQCFQNANYLTKKAMINYKRSYEDNLIYKF